jgi:hypothetical protein
LKHGGLNYNNSLSIHIFLYQLHFKIIGDPPKDAIGDHSRYFAWCPSYPSPPQEVLA